MFEEHKTLFIFSSQKCITKWSKVKELHAKKGEGGFSWASEIKIINQLKGYCSFAAGLRIKSKLA